MSRRSKQRRKNKAAQTPREANRLPQGALGGAAAAVAAAPLAGVPSIALDLSQPVMAPVAVVSAQSVSDDSGEIVEPARLEMTLPVDTRDADFSSMELDFFRRADLLYAQAPVENFDDLEPGKRS